MRRNKLTREARQLNVPLIEISMVDNGPGLVRTWLSAEQWTSTGILSQVDLSKVSLESERDIIERCFEKHRTSKRTPLSGIGLYDVHRIMRRLGAMLVVRTSRVRLVRDYSRREVEPSAVPQFENWDPKQPELPEIAGVSVSAFVPLIPLLHSEDE
jgi:hypothetical protein